jgi:hypothetical protein
MTKTASKPGVLLYVRFMDHLLFRNAEPAKQTPVTQEAWGVLDYACEDYIRLLVARYQEAGDDGKDRAKATGLVILRKAIVKMQRVGSGQIVEA